MIDLQLGGKRALVTGSSSGIGAAIAHMLCSQGVAVVVHGRNAGRVRAIASEIRAAGGKVATVEGALEGEGADAVAEAALQPFGGIDVLVNNAGGGSDGEDRSWFGQDIASLAATYDSNLIAPVRLIRALAPAMKERSWGRIINIATAAAITPTSGQPDYGPAKAAMISMSLGLSKALARTGVTSNCISPGMVRTAGLTEFLTAFAAKRGWGDDLARAEDYIVKGAGQTALRIGEVDDIAFAVTTLASPRSDFVNGTNFHIDGGISPAIC